MFQALSSELHPTAQLIDNMLVLEGFCESDPAVVATLAEADDLEGAVHSCLQIGARAARAVGAAVDAQVVERAFSALSSEFDSKVTDAVEHITGAAGALLDTDDGTLPVFLRGLQVQLAEQLDSLFDEDSKSSALALMEKVLEKASTDHSRKMRQVLDPADPDSALGRVKGELLSVMGEQFRLVLGQVNDIALAVSRDAGRGEIIEMSTLKGRTYQEQVAEILASIAVDHGDLVELLADDDGSKGGKVGDIVVRLAPTDTGGLPVNVLFEAKSWSRKPSLRKVLDELDRGMVNREAVFGLEVFSTLEAAPSLVPFTQFDNKAIVMCNGDETDHWALRLAYLWSRLEARRRAGPGTGETDLAQAEAALNDARRALGRVVTVRRFLGQSRNTLDKAGIELTGMTDDLREAIESAQKALMPGDA
jgi:hypothetical protein